MTYARARLLTGISGVGFAVLFAAGMLALDGPQRLLQGSWFVEPRRIERAGELVEDAFSLWVLLLGAAVVMLPFDLAGGWILPARFGRAHAGGARFFAGWARGVVVLSGLAAFSGALMLAAGRAGGRWPALVVFASVSALMLLHQRRVAGWVAGLRGVEDPSGAAGAVGGAVTWLEASDPGFTGGFSGSGARIVMPARWARELATDELALLIERRRAIRSAGMWARTRVAAVAWNTLGFGLALWLPRGGVDSIAELVGSALWFTLWGFIGLLWLPSPTRAGTLAADALLSGEPEAAERLARVVPRLDRDQDDEPERSAAVESVFHPIPAVTRRLAALEAGDAQRASAPAAWHLARTALFLSHAGLSLLPRAVHCNAGRPELWVYLPADG